MDEAILRELEAVRKQGKGVLYPESVIDYALNEKTALHQKFEWDDNKAGQQYRIWQARQLIKVCVTVMPNTDWETPLYVSLASDRYDMDDRGGYRAIVDVMSDDDLRSQLLNDALRTFNFWALQYQQLKELVPIFKAGDRVRKTVKKK